MNNQLKWRTLLSLLMLTIISCTRQPANDPGTNSSPPEATLKPAGVVQFKKFKDLVSTSPDVFSYPGELNGVGSAQEEELKLENIRKPIVYGVGAGGITMDTTYDESKTLLTPPFRGPYENGATLYNEQLYVVWKNEGDRKPQIIIPIKGYLGKMDGGQFGPLDFQTKFLDYKPDGQKGAARLIQDLFVQFEKVEDASYNCLQAGSCTLIYGAENQPNFVMVFPGAVLLMAKEEFQIAEIRIIRNVNPGLLANNLDLLTGDILVPGQSAFQLGHDKKTIFDRLEASPVKSSPEVYIQTDSLVYAWNGVYLIFHRNNYGVDVTEAEPTDVNIGVQVTPVDPAYLTLAGKRILMTQTPDDIDFALEMMPNPDTQDMDEVVYSETEVESKLKMNTKVPKESSMLFAKKFAEFLSRELANDYDKVRYRIWGFQNTAKVNKDITVSLSAYNEGSLQGVSVNFEVSEEQQKMNFMSISLMDPAYAAFSKVVLPQAEENLTRKMTEQNLVNEITGDPVMDMVLKQPMTKVAKSPVFTELLGFKLNDLVKLEDIDALGRKEATISYLSGSDDLGEIKERGGFIDEGVFNFPQFNRPTPRQQSYVSVYGTSLGLKIVGADESGAQYGRIVSISSGASYGAIEDICGLGPESRIKIAMKDTDVIKILEEKAQSIKRKNTKQSCEYFMVKDGGSLGLVKTIYFPQERLKLEFSERALAAVTIYIPMAEVLTAQQEVTK